MTCQLIEEVDTQLRARGRVGRRARHRSKSHTLLKILPNTSAKYQLHHARSDDVQRLTLPDHLITGTTHGRTDGTHLAAYTARHASSSPLAERTKTLFRLASQSGDPQLMAECNAYGGQIHSIPAPTQGDLTRHTRPVTAKGGTHEAAGPQALLKNTLW